MNKLVVISIGFIWIGIALGQSNPDASGHDMLALIKQLNLASGSMKYKSTELQRMLGEVNCFSEQLKLPTSHPIKLSDIQECVVSPPWFSGLNRSLENTNILSPIDKIRVAKVTIMGSIQTTNFFYAFKNGYLWNVVRLHEPEMDPENFVNLVGIPSLINQEQAYHLSVKWLSAVSVDVPAMEKKYKPQISQQSFNFPYGTTNNVSLPIYYVQWGEVSKVTILGTKKELIELSIQGEEISKRPQLVITNAIELCSTPNPQMRKLQSPLQTNLPPILKRPVTE